mmetsp:Transcript_11688/g.17903  ORF Transcript_11688/g.17903 Transcript_11688/m.17903 type:complete len:119 (-) Transcript_11688:132-488(-)|eukprot:CAMPEP_0201736598 /NCGR_PEP_ID=MMETSP0593-20130828/40181_1 /ASSEMBLY_ACC=CAM_ASM_000672 /TAXON_ID=267983 /ORGANISM="Skeletonema japonicum, Strain CCMP2506" /LENGTH=118 /DNA_ID=CAMNT_0048230395 /DNA_START=126 /DNA_END=482 /DNA_ORIENTATION=-
MSDDATKQKIGQKHPTPTPGNGDRVFYETLYNQRPDSEMAQEWCVAYGVLSDEDAAKIHKKILKRKAAAKSVGSSSPAPKSEKKKSSSKKKVKKVMDDVEFDAGMGAGGDEGIGIGAL